MAIELNETNFDQEINAPLVLVDFWAAWCGPCKAQAPVLEKLDTSKIKVCKLNVDENPSLSEKYGIMSIPTLLIFSNGELIKKFVGLHTLEKLNKLLNI